ncbi:MAG: hypothetical protein LUQ17_05360 [Methanomicrobiales archaeon]|nr:hypothetical protein [Methanomicrobiales archaeon]
MKEELGKPVFRRGLINVLKGLASMESPPPSGYTPLSGGLGFYSSMQSALRHCCQDAHSAYDNELSTSEDGRSSTS